MSTQTFVETYGFSAAHCLPEFPDGHTCRWLHGHFWTVEIHVVVDTDPARGYAFDHAELGDIAVEVLEQLDHRCINSPAGLNHPAIATVKGLERGLAEDILDWLVGQFGSRIQQRLPADLTKVVLGEMSADSRFRPVTHKKVWDLRVSAAQQTRRK